MARTGSFGRLPRALPSLTSTLIAIAREQESRRDQNIMDAWMKGGTFEGKKVTDSVMLSHWRKRLDGIAKDDPLYDMYRNAILQYEYSLAESKMTVKYAQERASDSEMANFYLNWAKKVPQDSEFYRVLQRDAAQYMRASRAKAKANADRIREEQYTRDMSNLDRQEGRGRFISSLIDSLAQEGVNGRRGPTGQGQFMPQGAPTLPNMQAMSTDDLQWLIGQVNLKPYMGGDPALFDDGSKEWLFTDSQGKRWTRGEVLAELTKNDPNFDGRLTVDYAADALFHQADIIQKKIDLADKTGHASEAARLRTQKADTLEAAETARAVPVMQKYTESVLRIEDIKYARGEYAGVTPKEQETLINKELANIYKLADDPSIANDGNLQSRLRGHAGLVDGVVTPWEDLQGTRGLGATNDSSLEPGAGGTETGSLRNFLEATRDIVDAVESGEAVLTQGVRIEDKATGTVTFVPQAGGKDWGAATPAMLEEAGLTKDGQVTILRGVDGKTTMAATVFPKPIYAEVRNPALKGKFKAEGSSEPIGHYYEYNNGKETVTGYLIQGANGPYISTEPPFDPKLLAGADRGPGGMKIDISDAVAATIAASTPDKLPGTGTGRTAVPGTQGARVEGRVPQGELIYETKMDPETGQVVSDKSRPIYSSGGQGVLVITVGTFVQGTDPTLKAGYDKNTDSPSLLLTSVKQMKDGPEFLESVKGTAAYDMAVTSSLAWAAGGEVDPTTYQPIIPAGKEAVVDRMLESIEYDIGRAKYSDSSVDAAWTNPALRGFDKSTPPGATGPKDAFGRSKPGLGRLPSDELRDMRDERMAPLYNAVVPQTTIIRPPETSPGFKINPGTGFKLPTLDPKMLPGPSGLAGGTMATNTQWSPQANTNTQAQTQQTTKPFTSRTTTTPRAL